MPYGFWSPAAGPLAGTVEATLLIAPNPPRNGRPVDAVAVAADDERECGSDDRAERGSAQAAASNAGGHPVLSRTGEECPQMGLSVAHRERLQIPSRVALSASNELSTNSAAIPRVHNQLPMSGASPGNPMARLHR